MKTLLGFLFVFCIFVIIVDIISIISHVINKDYDIVDKLFYLIFTGICIYFICICYNILKYL